MSEEDAILPSIQTIIALCAKVCGYFKNNYWYAYCGSARHRKCFQLLCTDYKQYHISVKCPKITRWLLLLDLDISIWYDDNSCIIRSEFLSFLFTEIKGHDDIFRIVI